MKAKLFGSASLLLALALALASAGAQEKKAVVGALPPHPLDGLFDKKKNANDVVNGLLNEPLFKKAVLAAVKARNDTEEALKNQPNLVGASPAQAARAAFLRTLSDNKDE